MSNPNDTKIKAKYKKKEDVPVIWTELQYNCDYCNKDISNTVRIRCAECSDELDLCLECFSIGVEIREKNHLNSHHFRLVDDMQIPLIHPNWSADEEQLMLEGLDQYGWANWEDVSGNIMTKTKAEIRTHYMQFYFDSKKWPLPDLDNLLITREDVKRINYNPKLLDTIAPRERGPNRKSTKVTYIKPQSSKPVRHDLANFMPFRGEFEVEWNNDAELAIKDITFDADDTSSETEMKFRLLEMYCLQLDEREARRQFSLERNLHDIKRVKELEKRRSKEEREVRFKTRKFNSIMTSKEYEHFIEILMNEMTLKQRIMEILEYRRLGLRTLLEVQQYKVELYQSESNTPRRGRPLSGSGKKIDDRYFGKKTLVNLPKKGQVSTSLELLSMYKNSKGKLNQLSDDEKEFLLYLRIKPDQYISMKYIIMHEYLKSGQVDKSSLKALPADTRILSKIFDYLQEVGWINKQSIGLLDLSNRGKTSHSTITPTPYLSHQNTKNHVHLNVNGNSNPITTNTVINSHLHNNQINHSNVNQPNATHPTTSDNTISHHSNMNPSLGNSNYYNHISSGGGSSGGNGYYTSHTNINNNHIHNASNNNAFTINRTNGLALSNAEPLNNNENVVDSVNNGRAAEGTKHTPQLSNSSHFIQLNGNDNKLQKQQYTYPHPSLISSSTSNAKEY